MRNLPILTGLFLLPTLAFAAPIDEQHGCGESETPSELSRRYCDQFESNPLFAADKAVAEAQAACLDFYRLAVEAQNVLCSQAPAQAPASPLAASAAEGACHSPPLDQGKIAGLSTAISATDKAVAEESRAAFRKALGEKLSLLQKSAAEYQGKIGKLMGGAYTNLAQEQQCWERPGSPVPSVLQAGLARTSFDEMQGNYRKLAQAIRAAGSGTPAAGEGEDPEQLLSVHSDPAVKPIAAPPKAPFKRTTDASRLFSQFFGTQGAGSALKPYAPMLGGAVPYLAKGAGAAVALVVEYHNRGKIDLMTLVKVGAFSIGGGWFMAGNLAISSYLDQKDERQAFLEFAQQHMTKNPNASAEDLSRAFAKNKNRDCRY